MRTKIRGDYTLEDAYWAGKVERGEDKMGKTVYDNNTIYRWVSNYELGMTCVHDDIM